MVRETLIVIEKAAVSTKILQVKSFRFVEVLRQKMRDSSCNGGWIVKVARHEKNKVLIRQYDILTHRRTGQHAQLKPGSKSLGYRFPEYRALKMTKVSGKRRENELCDPRSPSAELATNITRVLHDALTSIDVGQI